MIIACAFPSTDFKRAKETAGRWRAKGFVPLVALNKPEVKRGIPAKVVAIEGYEGVYRFYNWACNALVKYERADIVVCISDRMRPPEYATAHEIATTFAAKFPNGNGVMLPIGAAQEGDLAPCGPWIGRNFITRWYGGKGPYHERYFQYFGNRELFEVARKNELLWMRPEVAQVYEKPVDPDFWQTHNRKEYFERDASLYAARSEAVPVFPGHEEKPIETVPSLWLPPSLRNGRLV